jgi:hypothetical protein
MKSILKKIVCSVLLVFLSNASFSQGVVGMPELNVLYHGYDNKVQLGYQEGLADVSFKAEGATLTKTSNGYIVHTVKGSRQTEIIGTLKNGDTVCHNYYRNMRLPSPALFWGTGEDGGVASSEEKVLILRYHQGIVMENKFLISSWQVAIGERVFSGKGNMLSANVKEFIHTQATEKLKVSIVVEYTSTLNKNIKKTSGTYFVENPYFQGGVSNAKVYIIDKDSSNQDIFDPTNPFSLVGLVQHNTLPNLSCLSKIQSNRLLNTGAKMFLFQSKMQYIPLVEDNPSSTNFGNNKLETLPDGTMMYKYPEPINLYYDVYNINRIVLYESTFIDSMSGQKTTTISHVGLAKKYADSEKFDLVCVIPFNEIALSSDIETFQQVNDSLILNQYTRIPSNLDWDRAMQFGAQLEYLPNMLTQYGHVKLPFFSGSSKFDEYAHVFDSVDFVLEEQSPYPIATKFYGEDSTRILSDGTVEVVYPEREKVFNSLSAPADSIHMYVFSELKNIFYTNRNQPCFAPRRVVYTVNTKDGEYAFCEITYLNDYSYSYLFNDYIVALSQLEWKKQVQQAVSKGRAYDLTNKKDIKALDKQFNLDSYMGVPANLLGVCVGCN